MSKQIIIVDSAEALKKHWVKCPACDGQGWTAQHSTDANAHDEEGNCNPGYCPVQIQCETCHGTGKLLRTDALHPIEVPSDAEGLIDKLEKLLNMDDDIYPPDNRCDAAAALITAHSRTVPRAMLDEIYSLGYSHGKNYENLEDDGINNMGAIIAKYGYHAE